MTREQPRGSVLRFITLASVSEISTAKECFSKLVSTIQTCSNGNLIEAFQRSFFGQKTAISQSP